MVYNPSDSKILDWNLAVYNLARSHCQPQHSIKSDRIVANEWRNAFFSNESKMTITLPLWNYKNPPLLT